MPGRKRKRRSRPRSMPIQFRKRRKVYPSNLPELKVKNNLLIGSALTENSDASGMEKDQSTTVSAVTMLQGITSATRIGQQITVTSWHVKGNVSSIPFVNATVGLHPYTFFIALVLDKHTNGAQIKSEDVYNNVGGSTITCTQLMRNPNNMQRFKILDSRIIKVKSPPQTWDGTNMEGNGTIALFDMFVRFNPPLVVNYTGSSDSIGNVRDNSLHILACVSDVDLLPTISYGSRIRYRG